jgi:hypothetical protein
MEQGPSNESSAESSRLLKTERRSHRRTQLDRPVLLETSTRTATVRSVDVSGGGIAVRTDLALQVNERAELYFELPIGYAVEARAEVVRRQGDLLVLRFVELAREAEIAVRAFCRISGMQSAVSGAATTERGSSL